MGPLKNRATALYSNLALCYGKLNDIASFKKAAVQCIEVNPAFVKGYYRVEKVSVQTILRVVSFHKSQHLHFFLYSFFDFQAHSKSCGKQQLVST